MKASMSILLVLAAALAFQACEEPDKPSPGPNNNTTPVVSPETVGQPLSAWTEGTLDIHFINTSTGECTFLIFPDGTQMLVDAAGAHNATGPVGSTTNTGIRARWDPMKDADFRAGKYIADYVQNCMQWTGNGTLDYVLNTHFHGDHFGGTTGMPVSDKSSSYVKQSMAEILDLLPVGKLMDRGWPTYDYPFDMQTKASNATIVKNYLAAVNWHVSNTGLLVERFRAGAGDQITLQRNAAAYPDFKVQNVAVNGEIWDGKGTETATATFPALADIKVANPKSVGNDDNCPEENHCSTVFKLSYGKFDFYHGGDSQYDGCSTFEWKDMETPAAKASGAVDVMKADHHGVTNTNGYGYVAKNGHICNALTYLYPRCWIVNSWTDGHPREATWNGVTGLLSNLDIFITNTCSDQQAYSNFSRVKGSDGHIVVRVSPGGDKYFIYVLSDFDCKSRVLKICGPYSSR